MYFNDFLNGASEGFLESGTNQIMPTQSSLMFTPSHTSTNSNVVFSFQRTHNQNYSYLELFEENYELFHSIIKGESNSETNVIVNQQSEPASELPSPTPPFPNMLEKDQRPIVWKRMK